MKYNNTLFKIQIYNMSSQKASAQESKDDNFKTQDDKITNTPLAIAYMLAFCLLNAVCQSLSKYATTK